MVTTEKLMLGTVRSAFLEKRHACVLFALNSTKLLDPHSRIVAKSILMLSTFLPRSFLICLAGIGALEEKAVWRVQSSAKLCTGHEVASNKS